MEEVNAPMHVDTDKMAENTALTVYSRISNLVTPPLIALLFSVLGYFVAGVHGDVNTLKEEVPKVKERVTVMEANQARGRQDREEFQDRSLQQLDQIQSFLKVLGEGQASLTATINAQQRQIDQILNDDRRRP